MCLGNVSVWPQAQAEPWKRPLEPREVAPLYFVSFSSNLARFTPVLRELQLEPREVHPCTSRASARTSRGSRRYFVSFSSKLARFTPVLRELQLELREVHLRTSRASARTSRGSARSSQSSAEPRGPLA